MLEITRTDDGTVLLRGRFDASQEEAATVAFDACEGTTTVDCSRLDYVSSLGLGILLGTHKRLKATGHALRLIRVPPNVHEILKFAGFPQVMEIQG